MGPNEDGRLNSEAAGLRISLPAERENYAPLGVGIRFRIKGNCQITTKYQILQTTHPQADPAVGFELYLMADGAARDATSFCHQVQADGSFTYSAGRRTTNAQGRRIAPPDTVFKDIPAPDRSGQMRLTRMGAKLVYAAGDEAGNEFRELYRTNFGTEDIIMLRLGCNHTGANGLELRVVDLRIRTLDPE
jgi:hypothetical protein